MYFSVKTQSVTDESVIYYTVCNEEDACLLETDECTILEIVELHSDSFTGLYFI